MENITKYPKVSLAKMVSFISLNNTHYTILNMKIEMNDHHRVFNFKKQDIEYGRKQIMIM
jgi:hypothetical protein